MFHRRDQQGSIVLIAIFVIVVMGFMGISLMKIGASNQRGLTKEFLGSRAWFSAKSANEWAMTRLFPISKESLTLDEKCSLIGASGDTNFLAGKGCKIRSVTCAKIGAFKAGTLDSISLYRVESEASCGTGSMQVYRRQEVWIKSPDK